MIIIAIPVLIFLIVMIVKYTHTALIIGGSIIALGLTVKLARRVLTPPESRPAGNAPRVRAAVEDDLEWWKTDQTGQS